MNNGLKNAITLVATTGLICWGVKDLTKMVKDSEIERQKIEVLSKKDPELVKALKNFQNAYGNLKEDEFIAKRVFETESRAPIDSAIAKLSEKGFGNQIKKLFKK